MLKKVEAATIWDIANNLDDASAKLDACNETFSFILQELDLEGMAADNSESNSACFAARYPMYSKMLFLLLDSFRSCETTITGLQMQLRKEVGCRE